MNLKDIGIMATTRSIEKLRNRFFLPSFLRDMLKMGIGGLSGGNRVTLIAGGDKFVDTVLDSMSKAEKSINLESYIFSSDNVGMLVAEKLAEKARSGVEVNVIYDAIGSIRASSQMFNMMRDAGVEIIEFHPILPWKKNWGLTFRDHRKVLVIDGVKAFVGGINIGKEYAGKKYKGDSWRDTHVMVEGPAVKDVQFFFMENWYRNGGSVMNAGRHFPDIEEAGEKLLMVLCSRARRNVKPVHESYLSAMKNARHSIYITNAYFVPDAKIFRKLIKAAERGVDVRLLLPGESDIAIVKYASMYLYKRYLKNNIRIFEYQQSILHAKTAVIDGVWSTVGSSNLDRRSFRKNLEMNVVVLDQRFGDQMEVMFMKDLEKSKEIILQKFQRRSLYLFLLEWLCYRFRNLL